MNDPNLFWFGCVLFGGIVLFLLVQLGSSKRQTAQDASVSLQQEFQQASHPDLQQELEQQCLRLRQELEQQKAQLTADFQADTFEQLQSLLTNYPSAQQMAIAKPDLPARNLIALFTPLENLLQSWGIEVIGTAWAQVAFDPHLHQPDADDMVVAEPVYIRFVGYRRGEQILCPAKVSRTLPAGILKESIG
jgi:molecular chaperone GrpE (heat shock protein)